MVLSISSASQAVRRPVLAVLKIRTQKWHYFVIDGLPVGYSPVSLPVEPERKIHLQWISAQGRGERDVHVTRFKTLELEDSDFSQ